MTYLRRLLAVFAFVLCAVSIAGAQENAEITGSVTDSSGAAVPNATITVTHLSTGTTRSTQTNGAGLYDIPGLQIGTYNLQATATGFKNYAKSGLILNVAQTLRSDVPLEVGAASQTITVQANALQVQSETNEVSTLISGKQILQLATNGRNVIALTTLGTGVSNMMPSFNGVTAQGSNFSLSFNGMRPDHNNWLIDGGEVYDRGSGGKLGILPSPDVLAEFQTLSSNYSPDYGIASGGTVTMVLKSGTHNFHGGLWEFNRNDIFDANNYFSKQANQPIPELRLNIFGGEIGGPLFIPHVYNSERKKTYFFWSEEWRKFISGANPNATNTIPVSNFPVSGQNLQYTDYVNNGAAVLPVVPNTTDPAKLTQYSTAGLVAGQPFPYTCSSSTTCVSTIPYQVFDPNSVLFMGTGAIPQANFNGDQYIASPKQPTDVREDVVRIDHDLTDRMHLMGHWIHDQMSQTIFPVMWSGDSYPTVGNVFQNPSWGAVVKLSQVISPTLLNETAFNVNGNTIDITPAGIYQQPSGWSAVGIFSGNNAMNRLPQVQFSGVGPGTTYTTNYWPWHNSFLDYQVRDDLSWTRGAHSLKFGAGYMRMDKNQQVQADTQGDYTFNSSSYSGDSYVNFLLGFANSYQQLQQQLIAHWVNNTYSFYAMDNWHVMPQLTLNLGIRYDGLPHVYEKNNRTSNFVQADFNPADAQIPASDGTLDPNGPGFSQPAGAAQAYYLNGVQLAGVNGFPRGLVHNSYGTVQPRVGFAYDVLGNGKTVIRGGYGLFFERVQGNDIYGTDINAPWSAQPSVNGIYFSNPNTNNQTGATAAVPVTPLNFSALDLNYRNPATQQFSLGVQDELAPSIVMAVQYVGMTGWNQNDIRAINTLPLTDTNNLANPYDQREAVANGANANLYRQYPGWANIGKTENATNSNYHSLQAALRMENKHGLSLQLAYTWSHEIDIQSGDLTSFPLAGSSGQLSNPFNQDYDRGSGLIDRRHIFNANYIYDLPFFLHSSNGLARSLLGGWQISGITTAQSGTPTNVNYGTDVLGLGGNAANRPNLVGNVSYPKKQLAWFNPASFAAPTAPWAGGVNSGFGNAGKDTIVSPGLFNWNLSLFKEFRITSAEGPRFQLRAESYNTFNHTEFQNVSQGFTSSNFGQLTSTYDPRVLQFGAKFLF
ncbi:carboxypeptidase-like regulatory domain-containing protein [Acidobacterium sp. S8]|uniref:TonB-dependent receptor n=1 Tax=Acidobacterium sp. S8 TaxID=1641854 RepID=UPI00131B74F2|nr:carboxypeptidase-like regulatory domain-containing protein [Acidobacterium sp. S8]